MIYNTNLGIEVKTEPESLTAAPGETFKVAAGLKAGDMTATSSEQYIGYKAKLKILNAYQEEIDSTMMDIGEKCFESDYVFDEGIYYIVVDVRGNYRNR